MGRKLEWELSGKSDVPEKIAKAKASMEGLEGAANGLSKKFREVFKDIAVGFLAPMVLVQKAIAFIVDQMQQLRQFAQESREFAKDAEGTNKIAAGAREAIIQEDERRKRSEDARKRIFGEYQGYRDFLLGDPRGRKMLEKEMPVNEGIASSIISSLFGSYAGTLNRAIQPGSEAFATGMAARPEVQAKIEEILASEAAAREKMRLEQAAAAAASKAVPEVSSNVIGVGMSPQLEALNKSVALQEDMANSLRRIVEGDQASQGFRTSKFPDFGGATGRTDFPR